MPMAYSHGLGRVSCLNGFRYKLRKLSDVAVTQSNLRQYDFFCRAHSKEEKLKYCSAFIQKNIES